MELRRRGKDQIADPVEAEELGSMFLGAVGFLAEVADGASEFVPVIEAVGDPRAAGMFAALTAGGRRRSGAQSSQPC
ncbi:hypothetical protein [Nocardia sp. NPDC005998]|uniref:hypothetical protein n=1 Tax=Nocardia sp. NPDC005998 TaxID=3156894 RepID=UPI0033B122C7